MPEKILAITFSLLILVQACMVRGLVGTWIFPACLFSLFWFLYTFIPLVALFPVPINPYSVGYIFLCCLTFSSTAVVFNWRHAFERSRKRVLHPDYGSRFIRGSFYSITCLVVVCLIINTLIQGFSLNDVIFNLMGTSSRYMALRYSNELNVNFFGQLSVVMTYPAAILGGLVYASRPEGAKGINVILATFIPSTLVMLIQAAKGTLFLVIALFWSGILICKLNNGDKLIYKAGALRKAFVYGACIFPALIASFMARGLYEQNDLSYIVDQLLVYFASYSSAHLYAFSDWFSHVIGEPSVLNYLDDPSSNGFYTFMAVFILFGSKKVAPEGVYDEYFTYGEILKTNIYTIFRGLITDFGMLGTIAFMLALGLILHTLFRRQLMSKSPAISTSMFAHSLGLFYTSCFISILIWNSIYASFIVVSVILIINNKLSKQKPLRQS